VLTTHLNNVQDKEPYFETFKKIDEKVAQLSPSLFLGFVQTFFSSK
jgi:hypothetical protein